MVGVHCFKPKTTRMPKKGNRYTELALPHFSPKVLLIPFFAKTLRSLWPLSLEGVSQMDSILPERLLALVRPGNDLVLRRIRSLKRCVQACGVSARRAKKNREKKRKPSQTSQPGAKPNQPESQPGAKPNQPESQPEAKPNQPESQPEAKPNQPESQARSQAKPARKPARSQPKKPARVSFEGACRNKGSCWAFCQTAYLGVIILQPHARSVLDFKSFAGRGHFLDGRAPGTSQVE